MQMHPYLKQNIRKKGIDIPFFLNGRNYWKNITVIIYDRRKGRRTGKEKAWNAMKNTAKIGA